MKKATVIICVLLVGSMWWATQGGNYRTSGAPSGEAQYATNWNTSFHSGIASALAKNNVTGCGEYKFKASITHSREYLVRCTRDGTNWVTYQVWVGIDEVIGPRATNPKYD